MDELTEDCAVFKEYTSRSFSCDAGSFASCTLTAVDCNRYVCDGTSQIERSVAKGGTLYDLNCASLQEEDDWSKICRLNQAFFPEDEDSDTYATACLGKNAGCEASLELSSDKILTYEWKVTCVPILPPSHLESDEETTSKSFAATAFIGKVIIGVLAQEVVHGMVFGEDGILGDGTTLAIQGAPIIAFSYCLALAF